MLDDHIIQGLKAADKPKKYADGGGLFLFIPTSGKKLWRLAYRFERKAKLLSFGEYPQVSLRAARQRRDEAKALLKYSGMSIQEIAYCLNFPNQSFFGKYFRSHTGMTPSAYRMSK